MEGTRQSVTYSSPLLESNHFAALGSRNCGNIAPPGRKESGLDFPKLVCLMAFSIANCARIRA